MKAINNSVNIHQPDNRGLVNKNCRWLDPSNTYERMLPLTKSSHVSRCANGSSTEGYIDINIAHVKQLFYDGKLTFKETSDF